MKRLLNLTPEKKATILTRLAELEGRASLGQFEEKDARDRQGRTEEGVLEVA